MQPFIDEHREAVAALCRRYHVRRLDVFGSATNDEFDPSRSDIDFLVEFEPAGYERAFQTYFGLKEDLEKLFGRAVDLVMATAVRNPYLKASIERTRRVLYAA